MPARSRAVVGLALAGAVALGLTIADAAPASAHSALVASSPSPGERLAAPPDEVSLEFSEPVMELGDIGASAAVVMVVDADGRDWALGAPAIDRELVTIALDPALPGDAGYEVRWQVVSGDGHPISGVIPFVVGDGEPIPATAATASPSPAPSDDVSAASSGDDAADGFPVVRTVLVGLGGAAAAAAIFAVITFIARRRA